MRPSNVIEILVWRYDCLLRKTTVKVRSFRGEKWVDFDGLVRRPEVMFRLLDEKMKSVKLGA